jgi:uncharacterized protein YecE (DUF72 family)
MAGKVRIGISGWRYKGWRGVFYPEGLTQKKELAYAAGTFSTIEINGTFYSLQRPEYFRAWADATPDGFVFAVKGPRFLTHMKKLKDFQKPLANFMANGLLELGAKLGPILWQLPPNFHFNAEKLAAFFAALPRDTDTARRVARRHDGRVEGKVSYAEMKNQPLRHALEVRHDSFRAPAAIDLLRRCNIGLVVADTVDWPLLFDVTADFVYCRLHGSEQLYTSGYDARALTTWARRVVDWAREVDVYVYFDNDAKVRAPFDALALEKRVSRFKRPARLP